MSLPTLSFEFFPPRTFAGKQNLQSVWRNLACYQPEFFSVTFGAGGSTREHTVETVLAIQQDGYKAVPHLSCITASKADMLALLHRYQTEGIQRLVVLRGDLPSGEALSGEFRYASDLVRFIRQQTGDYFHIHVAAYPETHPESPSPLADLQYLKQKIDAGANAAITQYFYTADAYFTFCEEAQRMGIRAPIVPGVMPIYNATQLMRFSANCGADIPRWLALRLQHYANDLPALRAFGVETVSRLCERLLAQGVNNIHFYTLNQANIVQEILQNLQRHPSS